MSVARLPEPPRGAPIVVVIGTLDTKGREIRYLGARILEAGMRPLVVDSGILGEPQAIVADVTREDVARAAGSTLDAVRATGTRGAAAEAMAVGLRAVVARLHREGRCHGAVSLGGAEGAVMAAHAMQALPIGVPKLIVTPVAAGRRPFGPFVGLRDIAVMHSVIDIGGLNPISRAIFDAAAGAITGMVRARHAAPICWTGERQVALTMLGNTTAAVMRLEERLRADGYTPVIFHANGVGGRCMEQLVADGAFVAVIDFTTDELTDELVGGYHAAGADRLEAAGHAGLPQVVVPGCVDFFVAGPMDTLPPGWRSRPTYYHNPVLTLVRATREEMVQVARRMAEKLNMARGPVAVAVPRRGLSIPNHPGGVFWDPEADRAFTQTLRERLKPAIVLAEVDAHINDAMFTDVVFELFHRVTAGVTAGGAPVAGGS
ncbi:MAG: Tm-1-like ATP-binding domain-containing protein [Candidatus Rokubacteria bacterium]|nr:Tm-1-like ATP-binding domain-containing protein [Candidatus Rokubacteria bacterium]